MDNKICRFCLFKEKTGTNNSIRTFDDNMDFFTEKFSNCFGIQISREDSIPRMICKNCASFVQKIFSFLESIRKSELVWRELYKTNYRKPLKIVNENVGKDEVPDRRPSGNQKVETKNLEEVNMNSQDFLSCDSNSSFDEDIKKIKIMNELSLPDLRQKDNSLYSYGENDKVKIFKTDADIYSCSTCSRQFKTFFDYKNHLDLHDSKFEFCSKCKKVFPNRSDLVEHEKTHKVSCDKCNVQLLPSSLEAHMNKHSDVHKCTSCDARHTSKAAMEKHYKARHAGIKGNVCHICGKQNSYQDSMKRHLASHLSHRPFKCNYCNFAAKSRTVLRVHISRKHSNEKSNCKICSKMFKSVLSLNQHVKRMHNPKKHECNICGKAFNEKFNLDQHVHKKHSKQQIYECKVCHEEFFTVKMLKEHMHSHRQGCVKCPKCNKEFSYKKYLDKHLPKCSVDDESGSPRLKSTFSMPNTCTEYKT